jgi:hypothetical protein
VLVVVLGNPNVLQIRITEQKNCRTNGGLCRHRTPMHRGRARRRDNDSQTSEFGFNAPDRAGAHADTPTQSPTAGPFSLVF